MKKLITFFFTLVLAFSSCSISAGYVNLAPPPGWSQGLNAAIRGAGGLYNSASAVLGGYAGRYFTSQASITVASQVYKVPVMMRVASVASAVAAEFAFSALIVPGAILLAPIAYQWFKDADFEIKDGIWQKRENDITCFDGTCYEYSYDQDIWGSFLLACLVGQAARVPTDPRRTVEWTGPIGENICAGTFFYTPDGGLKGEEGPADFGVARRPVPPSESETWRPVSKEEFTEKMGALPMPDAVPGELPIVDWPVDTPVISPPSGVVPPTAAPYRIPTGSPQAIPGSSPTSYHQPVTDIVPASTPDLPWRVDVQPHIIDVDTPVGITEPVVVAPDAPPVSSGGDAADPALCDVSPDIAACAKLGGSPAVTPVSNVNKPLTIAKDSGWGPENGGCPPPQSLTLMGIAVSIPWTSFCDLATAIRPLVLGFAYLGAAFTFFGIGRKT